jgi:hypothetical protein
MFRFTIRDVLWLTVVVGLGVGWWVERTKLGQCRVHAFVLRDNLSRARWLYIHRKGPGLGAGPEQPIVDWEVVDEPIP